MHGSPRLSDCRLVRPPPPVRLSSCQVVDLSGCRFLQTPACQIVEVSGCRFIRLSMCENPGLSGCRAVRLSIWTYRCVKTIDLSDGRADFDQFLCLCFRHCFCAVGSFWFVWFVLVGFLHFVSFWFVLVDVGHFGCVLLKFGKCAWFVRVAPTGAISCMHLCLLAAS